MTKAEMKQLHKDGKLEAIGICGISNCSGVAICDLDDERVSGYWQVMDNEPEFFDRKLHHGVNTISFQVGKHRFKLDEFMRV